MTILLKLLLNNEFESYKNNNCLPYDLKFLPISQN